MIQGPADHRFAEAAGEARAYGMPQLVPGAGIEPARRLRDPGF